MSMDEFIWQEAVIGTSRHSGSLAAIALRPYVEHRLYATMT